MMVSLRGDFNLLLLDFNELSSFLWLEKQFKQNIDGVDNCTESLLINEKRKAKQLQKELDTKYERCEQVSKTNDKFNNLF